MLETCIAWKQASQAGKRTLSQAGNPAPEEKAPAHSQACTCITCDVFVCVCVNPAVPPHRALHLQVVAASLHSGVNHAAKGVGGEVADFYEYILSEDVAGDAVVAAWRRGKGRRIMVASQGVHLETGSSTGEQRVHPSAKGVRTVHEWLQV